MARPTPIAKFNCEICDAVLDRIGIYLDHMQNAHKKLEGKTVADMQQGAPLACRLVI